MTYKLSTLEETIAKFEELAEEEERKAHIIWYQHSKAYYMHKQAAAENRQTARWLKRLSNITQVISDGEVEDALLRTVKEEDDRQ